MWFFNRKIYDISYKNVYEQNLFKDVKTEDQIPNFNIKNFDIIKWYKIKKNIIFLKSFIIFDSKIKALPH